MLVQTRPRASPASGDDRVGNPSLATDAQAWRGPCGPPASRGPATPFLSVPNQIGETGATTSDEVALDAGR